MLPLWGSPCNYAILFYNPIIPPGFKKAWKADKIVE
jgi:hypothetical protein